MSASGTQFIDLVKKYNGESRKFNQTKFLHLCSKLDKTDDTKIAADLSQHQKGCCFGLLGVWYLSHKNKIDAVSLMKNLQKKINNYVNFSYSSFFKGIFKSMFSYDEMYKVYESRHLRLLPDEKSFIKLTQSIHNHNTKQLFEELDYCKLFNNVLYKEFDYCELLLNNNLKMEENLLTSKKAKSFYDEAVLLITLLNQPLHLLEINIDFGNKIAHIIGATTNTEGKILFFDANCGEAAFSRAKDFSDFLFEFIPCAYGKKVCGLSITVSVFEDIYRADFQNTNKKEKYGF